MVGLADLHSFPTRRSSDLPVRVEKRLLVPAGHIVELDEDRPAAPHHSNTVVLRTRSPAINVVSQPPRRFGILPNECAVGGLSRSEEHTSELQSQSNLVCRL